MKIMKTPVPFLVEGESLSIVAHSFDSKTPISQRLVRGFMYNSREVPGATYRNIRGILAHMIKIERERQKTVGGPVEIASVFAGLFRKRFLPFAPSPDLSEDPKWKAIALFPFVHRELLASVEKITCGPERDALYYLYRWLFAYYQHLVERDSFYRYYASLDEKEKGYIDKYSSLWTPDEEYVVKAILSGVLNAVALFITFLEYINKGDTPEEASYNMEDRFALDYNDEVGQVLAAFEQEGPIVDYHLAETMAYFASYPAGEEEKKKAEEMGNVYHFIKAEPHIKAYREKLLRGER